MPLIAESSLLRRILAPPAVGSGTSAAPAPEPAGTPVPPPEPGPPPGSVLPPGGPGAPDLPLEAILRRRESVRSFAASPISRDELELIIQSGLLAERTQWPPDTHPDLGITIATAAFGVDGLDPGLYLPAPGQTAFSAVAADGGWLAGLPDRYAPAPVLLLVCGDPTRASAAMGAPGYPRLLVRAGAAGYGTWLRAISIGLAGCPFGAANHQLSTVVSRLSGGSLRHLFTIAIGTALRAEDSTGHEDIHDH